MLKSNSCTQNSTTSQIYSGINPNSAVSYQDSTVVEDLSEVKKNENLHPVEVSEARDNLAADKYLNPLGSYSEETYKKDQVNSFFSACEERNYEYVKSCLDDPEFDLRKNIDTSYFFSNGIKKNEHEEINLIEFLTAIKSLDIECLIYYHPRSGIHNLPNEKYQELLKELIRLNKIEEFKTLMGSIEFNEMEWSIELDFHVEHLLFCLASEKLHFLKFSVLHSNLPIMKEQIGDLFFLFLESAMKHIKSLKDSTDLLDEEANGGIFITKLIEMSQEVVLKNHLLDNYMKGLIEACEIFLAHPDFDINYESRETAYAKETFLLLACSYQCIDIVSFLLEKDGININKETIDGFTPLFYAAGNDNIEIVDLLLQQPSIDINTKDSKDRCVLYHAGAPGNNSNSIIESAKIIRLLLMRPDIIISLPGLDELILINLKRVLADPRAIFTQVEIEQASTLYTGLDNEVEVDGDSDSDDDDGDDDGNDIARNGIHQRALLRRFFQDPEVVREECRAEIEKKDAPSNAASLFAMVIFYCDDYMRFRQMNISSLNMSQNEFKKIQRFFTIASRLPIELQMLLGNRSHGLSKDLIPSIDRELAFRNLASGRLLWFPKRTHTLNV